MEITEEKIATLRMELLLLGTPIKEVTPDNSRDTLAKWRCLKPFIVVWVSNSSCSIVAQHFSGYTRIEDVAVIIAEIFNGSN